MVTLKPNGNASKCYKSKVKGALLKRVGNDIILIFLEILLDLRSEQMLTL